ncbi:MAG TPA: DUF1269 domain-containing protein [Gemmataceae bacterium]|jgi:uncharacterized membrane protein|nr:DUF1269 domain-containing protein [Gemmataceae bacterium]
MTIAAHLWAVGYDDMGRAEQVRGEVARLGERHCLRLLDTAVVVRCSDGCVTLNGEPFVSVPAFRGHTLLCFLAGLAMGAPPLTGAAVGAWERAAGGTAAEAGIGDAFVSEVQALMRPGTSALFVLDQEGDMPAILQGIRGLGGTVLKANVDLQRAQLIQSTLAAAETLKPDGR